MTVNMIFNLILFYPLAHVGLALATSISAIVNASLLFWALRKAGAFSLDSSWLPWLSKLAGGNIVLVAFIVTQMADISQWQNWQTSERVEHMVVLVVLSVLIYALSMVFFGVRGRHLKHH